MKKSIFTLLLICSITVFNSCTDDTKKETESSVNSNLWAEVIESKTNFVKPQGWDDEYWNSVNKGINKDALFNTIVDAVLSGKKEAYNIFTDSILSIDEVKEIVKTTVQDTVNKYNESKVGPNDLSLIRMREKWTFDKEKFRLEKKVTRIDLTYKKLDLSGEYVGDKALFYVYLD